MIDIRFDLTHPPFNLLTPEERENLTRIGDLVFFDQGAEILSPGAEVTAFYLVAKGIVSETGHDKHGNTLTNNISGVYRENDVFDSRALITGHTTNYFIAHEETLLFELPRATVLALTESNPAFGAYFYARLSEKLGMIAQHESEREWQSLFGARIRDIGIRPPVFIDGNKNIAETARVMKEKRCRSVFIKNGTQTGIFTTGNFRDLIIDAVPADTPVAQYAQYDLLCCHPDDHLFNALLTMTRENVHRVVVVEHGQPIGVIAQVDLLSYFSNHSHLAIQQIELAETIDELENAARRIDTVIETLAVEGMKAPQLSRLVQVLSTQLMARLWALLASPEVFAKTSLWALGSEGRGEQILKTDQDNALIFDDSLDRDEVARTAEAFTQALSRMGYPLCQGGIMVNHADWRGTMSEWRERLHHWIYQPQKNTWMHLAAFIDAETICGNRAWLQSCKDYFVERVRNEHQWLSWMARAIQQFDDDKQTDHSHHFWHQLLHRHHHARFDLKKGGIFPIVHGVRVLALDAAIHKNNTFDRLNILVEKKLIERDLGEDLHDALSFFMMLKLNAARHALDSSLSNGNIIDTHTLSSIERDLLKEALAVVKRFKTMIHHHYHLERY